MSTDKVQRKLSTSLSIDPISKVNFLSSFSSGFWSSLGITFSFPFFFPSSSLLSSSLSSLSSSSSPLPLPLSSSLPDLSSSSSSSLPLLSSSSSSSLPEESINLLNLKAILLKYYICLTAFIIIIVWSHYHSLFNLLLVFLLNRLFLSFWKLPNKKYIKSAANQLAENK